MSLTALTSLLNILNAMTPLGIIALLAVIILLLVHPRGPLRTIKDNHLSHAQDSLERIATNSDKQVEALGEIKADIAWVKGRLS